MDMKSLIQAKVNDANAQAAKMLAQSFLAHVQETLAKIVGGSFERIDIADDNSTITMYGPAGSIEIKEDTVKITNARL